MKRTEAACCPKCKKGTPFKLGKDSLHCRLCGYVWKASAAQLVQLGGGS